VWPRARARRHRQAWTGGTYEKVVPGLPYLIAYSIEALRKDREIVLILRVIHGARYWPSEAWPP